MCIFLASHKDTNQDSGGGSNDWGGLNLSSKSSMSNINDNDVDIPLNLSLKSTTEKPKSNDSPTIATGSNSLQSLSSITAALGTGGGGDRICKLISPSIHRFTI